MTAASLPSSSSSSAGGVQFEISHRPDYSFLKVRLREGEQLFAEPSAMATMEPTVELKAGFKGGMMKSLARAFGGESLIINTFTAKRGAGEVTFAPGPMGDLQHYAMRGVGLLLQRGAYVAHGPGVDVSAKWQGMKGFFSGEGLVLLRATGQGDLFFNTFGGLVEIDVTDEYYVDTGYVAAFEDTLQYKITTLPGLQAKAKLKTFFLGGEGLVCRFSGQGKLWIQTRCPYPFLNWLQRYRPVKKSNS